MSLESKCQEQRNKYDELLSHKLESSAQKLTHSNNQNKNKDKKDNHKINHKI